MANDDEQGKTPEEQQDDSGIDNLPPLSSFDSSGPADEESDAGLPPLGTFDSDKGGDSDKPSVGGLPPVDDMSVTTPTPAGGLPAVNDISVETPAPTGGNIKAPPPGFESAEFESPGFETPPAEPKPGEEKGTGFQDLQANSDFSPETPEIGPGPDTDVDTPMFDSAFGGEGGESFTPAFETPAPTQAMETPMFGEAAGAPAGDEMPAFDEGAFTPDAGLEGTPPPDFGPDTAMTAEQPPVVTPMEPVGAPAKGGGLAKVLMLVVGLVVGVLIGALMGPSLSNSLTFIPNPLRPQIAEKDAEIARLDKRLDDILNPPGGQQPTEQLTQKQIDKMIEDRDTLAKEISTLTTDRDEVANNLEETQGTLDEVRGDLDALNQEYVTTQEAYEDLQNQTAIVQARQLGLKAEVERLTGLTGKLDDANARRRASKDALAHSVDQLTVQIKEGIPLTPEKYLRAARLAAAQDLAGNVAAANWVTPALLNAYTDLYGIEMEIAASTEYFFAKIPITTRLGVREEHWAECLMHGNWRVTYRTLDGKSIGAYENIAGPGDVPVYAFREQLPKDVKETIEQEIFASRIEGFEEKIALLAEKQDIAAGEKTGFQRVFDSL